MIWNWQKPDWPNFRYDAGAIEPFEARFLRQGGIVIGTTRHFEPSERELRQSARNQRRALARGENRFVVHEGAARAGRAILARCVSREEGRPSRCQPGRRAL